MFKRLTSFLHRWIYVGLRRFKLDSNQRVLNFFKHAQRLAEYVYLFIRCQKPLVRLFGYCYTPSRELIEIDLTYRCNLACNNCNRSLGIGQAKSAESISLEQIRRFVAESVEQGFRWKRIKLLGGEPTLHPQFLEILAVLRDYRDRASPATRIQVWSNGAGARVQRVLDQVPADVRIINTSKVKGVSPLFNSFNLAPMDSPLFRFADFANGCSIIEKCGVGLTPYGYYPCAIAGGIDRIIGLDKGEKRLDAAYPAMRGQLDSFCRYCGHFRLSWSTTEQVTSPAWQIAYETYRKSRPQLSEY